MKGIFRERKKRKLSQEKLAEMIGVNRSTIAKWETDAAYPKAKNLLALSNAFGCRLDDLLTSDDKREGVIEDGNQ